jgi:hypothetical protein
MALNFKSGMIVRNFKNRLPAISIGLAFTMLILASCLPDPLEVQSIPVLQPQIVVSTQIIPDQSLLVLLTRTFGALDASDDSDPQILLAQIAVNDALVTVEGPQGIDTLTFLGSGTYGGIFIEFEPGETYQLYVNSPALGEVHATTDVKPKVDFASIDAELSSNGYGDTLSQITYAFADSTERNWYMINIQEVERKDLVENILNPRAHTVLVSDSSFNGETYSEKLRIFPRDYHPGDTIAVSLSNISESYYRFMQLRLDNRYTFVEFISEPVNYPSNIEGGKGYFNLYVPDVRFFVFE